MRHYSLVRQAVIALPDQNLSPGDIKKSPVTFSNLHAMLHILSFPTLIIPMLLNAVPLQAYLHA